MGEKCVNKRAMVMARSRMNHKPRGFIKNEK
jgi:hypothetical protein